MENFRPKIWLYGLLWAAAMTVPARAVDDETAKTIADLKAQVQALVERVRVLEGRPSSESPPSTSPGKTAPASSPS
ncbi:MAG: hypothetical protein ACKODZ_11500, partial [Verrucomicrobiota bacterium]